jgi:hypothetical protein
VNVVRQKADDTKDKNPRWQTEESGSDSGVAVEKPEEVMMKLQRQATCLGPVMEELLRATQERGQSHWGLND